MKQKIIEPVSELKSLIKGQVLSVDFGNMLNRGKIGKLAMVEGQEHFRGNIGFVGRFGNKDIYYITVPRFAFNYSSEGIAVRDHIGFYSQILNEGEQTEFLGKRLNYQELNDLLLTREL